MFDDGERCVMNADDGEGDVVGESKRRRLITCEYECEVLQPMGPGWRGD